MYSIQYCYFWRGFFFHISLLCHGMVLRCVCVWVWVGCRVSVSVYFIDLLNLIFSFIMYTPKWHCLYVCIKSIEPWNMEPDGTAETNGRKLLYELHILYFILFHFIIILCVFFPICSGVSYLWFFFFFSFFPHTL